MYKESTQSFLLKMQCCHILKTFEEECTWQELERQKASPPWIRPSLQASILSCDVSDVTNIWVSRDCELCKFVAYYCSFEWSWFGDALGCCCCCNCFWCIDALGGSNNGHDWRELGCSFERNTAGGCICYTCGSRTCSLWSCCTIVSLDCC